MKSSIITSVAALAFCLALTAQAQTRVATAPDPSVPAAWNRYAGQQLAQLLEAPSEEARQQALGLITHLALQYGDQLDLREAVPALLTVYQTDPSEQNRMAAVAGISAIGDEGGLYRLRRMINSQPSERVQYATLAALWGFYGPETFAGEQELAAMAASLLEGRQRASGTVLALNQ